MRLSRDQCKQHQDEDGIDPDQRQRRRVVGLDRRQPHQDQERDGRRHQRAKADKCTGERGQPLAVRARCEVSCPISVCAVIDCRVDRLRCSYATQCGEIATNPMNGWQARLLSPGVAIDVDPKLADLLAKRVPLSPSSSAALI